MIKILFFIDTLGGGGAEKVLCNLVNGMDFSGFDVTVQTLFPEEGRRALDPHIHYKWCYPADSRLNSLRMRAETALGLTYPLHIRDDYDVEIAYLECGPTKILSGSTSPKAVKLAWVHCDLAKKAEDPAEFVRKTAKYYRRFDRIVCVSEDVRQSFLRMYGDAVPVQTLCNCYDDREIREKAAAACPAAHPAVPVCAAVGRMTRQKGFDRLLQVHERLIREGIAHELWILGDGPDRPQLEQFIRGQGLEGSVKLMGFQKNPYPYLNTADFLVCASRFEGFSTVAVEGLILGKTMVTTRCTGMEEIFGDSESGLITENSAEGLYLGMKRMLTEPGLLEEYTEKAMRRGREFGREKLVRETEAFLLQTLESSRNTKRNRRNR